jgi:predicted ATPase/predicted Ser/Thr protein kinase
MNGALEAGSELAGYRIAGLLGRGGMGFVYEAEHLLLKRKAALKTLAPELGGGNEFRERFIRESQTVASIDHPNIIPIYDAGDLGGLVFIAMRYVQGPDLEQMLEQVGALDAHQALSILEQVAGALDAAHAHEIVHRDVKPPNVMIEDGSGRIYLMDFGIAKQGGRERGMTEAGMFIGTVDYAAPEQVETKEITHLADIYAFGGVLFQCLTGKKPYERDSEIAVMYAHVTEPPPKVTDHRPELPEALDAVIAKAMAKAPDDRYQTCRAMIDDARAALGDAMGPSSGATMMPGLTAAAPETEVAVTSNLPTPPTALVGRDEELQTVMDLVHDASARLVTLTGLGGTGKTRLALEAVNTLAGEFDESYFVDLAPIQDPQLVGSAIAEVLGVREAHDRLITETIAERIGDHSMLLFLDNFEQVLTAAPTIGELLGLVPALKVVTTSRAPLHVRGEREYAVPPLGMSDDPERAANSAAVRLFVERAQEAKASFELSDDNADAVIEICRQLEGIPLAIELAAARVKLMTPAQILERLGEKRLSFLTGSATGDRQGTLREAIDWSYNLLDDTGKAVFARLGVFVGGCSLDAAEAVAGQPLGLEFGEVLDGVAQLVDNSLLRQGESADGEPRFNMLETIREYAIDRLAEIGELEHTRDAHLERYLALAETAEPELTRAGQAAWLQRLTEENDNIRAALAWSFESAQVELGLRLAGALVRYWSIRGLMTEGRRWLADALDASTGVPSGVLAKAYYAAGFAALGQGDYLQAKPFFEEALQLARQAEDVRLEAQALQQIGWIVMTRGTYEDSHETRARELASKALELAQGIGDKLVQSGALNILAELAGEEGDEQRERELYEQSLTLRRELGDRRLIANSVLTLGRAELTRGEFERATPLLQEGFTLAKELHDTWSMSLALIYLGRVELQSGGEPDEAGRLFSEALALAKERGDKRVAAECLQGLAAVLGVQGDHEDSAKLFGAGDALLESIGATPSSSEIAIGERFVPPVREALGEERFGEVWSAGHATPPDQAIELGITVSRNRGAKSGGAAAVLGKPTGSP